MNTATLSSHVCPGQLRRTRCADCRQAFALLGQSVARQSLCPSCLRRMNNIMHQQVVEAEGRDCD